MDAQGAEAARPWVEKADPRYKVVVDQENVVGELYGLKAVPIGILVDEDGRLAQEPVYINVSDDDVRSGLVHWVEEDEIPKGAFREAARRDDDLLQVAEADVRFRLGQVLLEQENREEAMAQWRKAWQLEPDNWLIRKQVWAVENPERFYDGEVDYEWQREQIEAGR